MGNKTNKALSEKSFTF